MKKLFSTKRRLNLALLTNVLLFSFYLTNLNAKPLASSGPDSPDPLKNKSVNATGSASWTLDKTVSNVECYYKVSTCNGVNTVFLKFNNKNPGNVKILWKESFQTQLENSTPGVLSQKELILLPGETADNDCNSVNEVTIIRSPQISPTYPAEVKQFSFSNISVIKL